MKLLRKRHEVEVLTGETAREHIRSRELDDPSLSMAVAVCSCGWEQPALHGEEAERLAEEHRNQ